MYHEADGSSSVNERDVVLGHLVSQLASSFHVRRICSWHAAAEDTDLGDGCSRGRNRDHAVDRGAIGSHCNRLVDNTA